MKKYHISIFTTNLLAIVLAVFFARGYNAKGIPITNISIIMAVILAVFLILTAFMLKPRGKIENIFPSKGLLLLNSGISAAIGLFFLREIGLMGFFFVLLFSFLLSEIEHIIYEGVGA
ncbi:MAG: hypothetical protein AABX34_03850 [Nanoarchaeota archaeon]